MQRLIVFENISLDGYFVDRNGAMDWAKAGNDDEFNAFAAHNAKGGGTLIFGRVTYEMMAGFWPTPQAKQMMPDLAASMNAHAKVVFSRTLAQTSWNNTQLLKGELVGEIRRLKNEMGPGLTILGSGSLVAQLAPARVIDEYQFVVNPVALGGGRTVFEQIPEPLGFELASSRTFRNGKVFLSYRQS